MKIKAYKTKKVQVGDKLLPILDQYLPKLHEGDIVVITSKIISICQGRVVKKSSTVTKHDLVMQEADYSLPEKFVKHGVVLTIKNNIFIASAGIDESNGNNYYILWPKDLFKLTGKVWEYLRKKHKVNKLGVMVTDSRVSPLRRGVTAVGLSWCGFAALRSYIGKPDIFGKKLRVTYVNNIDALGTAAAFLMGEGKEQTPLAVISDLDNIEFQDRVPTAEEIKTMRIDLEDDIFASFIKGVPWLKNPAGERVPS